MKTSELIKVLQESINEVGDVDVSFLLPNYDYGISFQETGEFESVILKRTKGTEHITIKLE